MDVNTLVNGRTFAFDLDSVYGGGPTKSPQLYYGDKFLLGISHRRRVARPAAQPGWHR